jgi:hypothetical protein
MAKNIKGIVYRDEYFFQAYNSGYVLYVHALIVSTNFCFLVDEKIKLKDLACSCETI